MNLILDPNPSLINNTPPLRHPERILDPLQTRVARLELRPREPLMVSKLRRLRIPSESQNFGRRLVVLHHTGVPHGDEMPRGRASLRAHVDVRDAC